MLIGELNEGDDAPDGEVEVAQGMRAVVGEGHGRGRLEGGKRFLFRFSHLC